MRGLRADLRLAGGARTTRQRGRAGRLGPSSGAVEDQLRAVGHSIVIVLFARCWPFSRTSTSYSPGSSVMDAAVAGTPCVVHPATDEQRAVADRIEAHDVHGFAVAESPFEVIEAVVDPPEPPRYENGADAVASAVLDDLESRGEVGGDTQDEDRTRSAGVAERASRGANRAVTAGARAAVGTAEAARAGVARGVGAGRAAAVAAGRSARATAAGCRRYGAAAATLLLVTAVFVGGRTRRTGRNVGQSVVDGVKTVGSVLESTASGVRRAAGRLRRVAPTVR